MTSAIDPSKPVAGNPTTQSVRDNFTASKSEIEALQATAISAVGTVQGQTVYWDHDNTAYKPTSAMIIDPDDRIGLNGFVPTVYNAGTNDLVFGADTGDGGMVIRSGSGGVGGIYFNESQPFGPYGKNAGIRYDNSSDTFLFTAGSSVSGSATSLLTLDSGGSEVYSDFTCDNLTSTGIDDNATGVAITVDSSENVGIGTTSPDYILDVEGPAGLTTATPVARFFAGSGASADWGRIDIAGKGQSTTGAIIYQTSSGDSAYRNLAAGGILSIVQDGAGSVVIQTNGSTRLLVDSAGDITINGLRSTAGTTGQLYNNGDGIVRIS